MKRIHWLSALSILVSVFAVPAHSEDSSETSKKSEVEQGTVEVLKQSRVRLGGVALTGGSSHFSAPSYWGSYGGYYPSGYWGPFWQTYSPFAIPYPMPFYAPYGQPRPDMGEIRLHAEPETASVYLNQAYAGTVEDLKTIRLEPGVYDLRIEAADGSSYSRRLYVLSGKTLRVDASLAPAGGVHP